MITKEYITNTAFKILSKEGAKSLTSARLIEEAGISKGGLYHHFENLDEVYLSVLEMLTDSLTEGFFDLEFRDIDHLNEVLVETVFDEIEDLKDVYSSVFYFISSSNLKPEYDEYLKQWLRNSVEKWSVLHNTFYGNRIPEQEINEITRMTDMFFGGLIIHGFMIDDMDLYKKITRDFLDMIKVRLNKYN